MTKLRWLELPVSPFRRSARLAWSLPGAGVITLGVFDVSGRQVARLVSGAQAAGHHRVDWEPANVPSGVYFARLHAGGESLVRRLVYLRP